MTIPKQSWTVNVLDDLGEEGLQLVADFFNENFPGVFFPLCSPALFRWKLGETNPAGRGFMTVAISDGRVVGTTSATRRILNIEGRRAESVEIGDTFTHPEFRKSGFCETLYPGTGSEDHYLNKSIFGRLVTETLDRVRNAGISHVYGTPNANSKPPYISRLAFHEISEGKIRIWSYITPNLKVHSRFTLLIRLLTQIQTLVQRINLKISGREIEITNAASAMMIAEVGSAIQHRTYFGTLKSGFTVVEQSPEFIRHRYVDHPSYVYQFFRVQKKNVVIGWIICMRVTRQSGRDTLVISDWINIDGDLERELPLYVGLIAATHRDVEIVTLWANGAIAKGTAWARFGFIGRNQVSVIAKNLIGESPESIHDFADFRIGWSDNG